VYTSNFIYTLFKLMRNTRSECFSFSGSMLQLILTTKINWTSRWITFENMFQVISHKHVTDHIEIGKLYGTPKFLFDSPSHLLIPQGPYWYPRVPIDTPGCLLIPQPVVLFTQSPVAPAILVQIRWFLYHWKVKNQIYKMVSFICQSVDICLYKWAICPWIANFYEINNLKLNLQKCI
jgi:hypothetical protein